MYVGQCLADCICDLGEDEALLAMRAEQDDVGQIDGLARNDVTPGVVRFLFNRGVDGTFEGEIGGDGGSAPGGNGGEDSKLRDAAGRRGKSVENNGRRGGPGAARNGGKGSGAMGKGAPRERGIGDERRKREDETKSGKGFLAQASSDDAAWSFRSGVRSGGPRHRQRDDVGRAGE